MMQEYRVWMTYRDKFGTHNVTEWVDAVSEDGAVTEAKERLQDARGVRAGTAKVVRETQVHQ